MTVSVELIDAMYTQIVLGTAKNDFAWPLSDEASALWDEIAADVAAHRDDGVLFDMVAPELGDVPRWLTEGPQGSPAPPPAPQAPSPAASWDVSAHLSGKHDQRKHGRKGGGGRAGMGDIEITPKMARDMANGSGGPHLVKRPDGTYGFSPERQALHDDIINRHLEGQVPSANPTYHVLGGGPAAGKSSYTRSEAGARTREGLQINADDMKAELPDYTAMIRSGDKNAANFTHEESSYLSKRLQAAGFENRFDVTLDGTGDSSPDKLRGKIDAAHAAGYRVEGHYMSKPTADAFEGAEARANDPNSPDYGRHIPETYLRTTHAAVSRTVVEVAPSFDALDIYDTSGGPGSLLHVASQTGGTMTILDQAAWDRFVAKGSEA
jgi:predicted ABC-type ATPase